MQRYRLTLEFDGSAFVGWQYQTNGLTVQEVVETAIGRFCKTVPRIMSAGRTDSGVHALGMVAHADIDRDMTVERLFEALNFHMRPHPVVVREIVPVAPDFDARRSCIQRHYVYRILNRPAPPALDRGRVWHVVKRLDLDLMREGAARLVGHRNFESFRSAHCQSKTAAKTLERLEVERQGEEVLVRASARSFLHNQVRILTGTLVEVGKGRWTPDDVTRALEARDRQAAGPTAPACGLYFLRADYPPETSGRVT